MHAAEHNKLNIIDEILTMRVGDQPLLASLDFENGMAAWALLKACENGHVQAASRIIDAKCSPSSSHGKCLHKAAQNGHLKVIELLINRGCEPSVPSEWAEFSGKCRVIIQVIIIVIIIVIIDNNNHIIIINK